MFTKSGVLHLLLAAVFTTTAEGQHVVTENRDVIEGESLRLECRFHKSIVSANTQYYWTFVNKNTADNAAINKIVLDSHYTVDFAPEHGKYDLIITRAEYEKDNGQYVCRLKEPPNGYLYNVTYAVTVLIPPGTPRINPQSPAAKEKEPFVLTCLSEGGSPDPIIQWYREGEAIQGKLKKGGSRDQPTSNVLTINPEMEDDGAVYKCAVWNRAIKSDVKPEAATKLQVHYSPRVTVGPYSPLNVMADSDAILTCSVSANPTVRSVRWLKDGRLLSNSRNHTIPGVTPEDSGTYTCVADNGINNAGQAHLELSVL